MSDAVDVATHSGTASPTSGDRADCDAILKDLYSPAGRLDPYSRYAQLRKTAPVHLTASGSVILTGYDDCAAVLRNPVMRTPDSDPQASTAPPGWQVRPASRTIGESMLVRNPPEHTRLRRLVSGAFSPRRVMELAPDVQGLVDTCLDRVADAGADGGTVNLRDLLAFPLPSAVIAAMLGIPESDWDWLIEPMADIVPALDLSVPEVALDRADDAARLLLPYFGELAAARRERPHEDLITALVTARDGDQRLTEEELVPTIILIYAAGFTTTVGLITNGVLPLLRSPEQLALLRSDPTHTPAAVSEALRYDTPVQAVSRAPAEDVVIGGVAVPAGTKINPFLAAANRDPLHFPDPDRFDITRTGGKGIGFGGGVHYCLGSALARLEGEVVFRSLVERFPKLALAGEPELSPEFNFRSYARVPVTVR
ncbi:cytochrome P450 (plasmid) [Streptomyces sp. NBC_00440]|uniref:cytochrome P450 n=1 Tax=unclassified Streptomyces TaxID=2593676 RepID=UPI002E1B11A8|nr:cytochrome P450 [Streptomyces sp. NBC_00963]